jgi:hypothetical protein
VWLNRDRALVLALRQRELLLHSALQRQALVQDLHALAPPLGLADRVRGGAQWLRTHPELPLAAAVVVLLLRPRRALRWAGKLWWGWRLWRKLQRFLVDLDARSGAQGAPAGRR